MTPEDAAKLLIFHSTSQPGGFLAMLRPYRGLRVELLDDVMASLRACAPLLMAPDVPRDLVSAVWGISFLARSWALCPEGMLRRNHLIADADLVTLSDFLERYDYAVMMLLDGVTEAEAFGGEGR